MPKKAIFSCLAALLVAAPLVSVALAADLGLTTQQIDVSQFPKVRIYVTVADSQGMPITGLDAQAFTLAEDGKPIKDFRVEPVVDSQESIAVALNIDVSGSMKDNGKLDAAKQAAAAFIDTMGAKDSVAVVSFADTVKVVQGFTGDKAALTAGVQKLETDGDTSLYDAVIQSSQLMGALPQGRKVVIVLTDGADTKSKQSLDDAMAAAKDAHVLLLAVGLGPDVKKEILDKLAGATAGQAVYVAKPDQLRQVFLSFGDQLRRQYVLQYTSQLPGDGKQHEVAIQSTYRGQKAEVKGSFLAKSTPLSLAIKGIDNASKVSGPQKVEVTVTGGTAKTVELLVDDQQRAVADSAPFLLQWDATNEKPGIHRIIVRAKDAAGTTTDKEYVVEVVGAAPAAAATPAATPGKGATATAAPQDNTMIMAGAAAVALLAIIGLLVWFFVIRKRPRLPGAPKIEAAPKPDLDDRTENIDYPVPATAAVAAAAHGAAPVPASVADSGATVIGAAPALEVGATVMSDEPVPSPPPKARLLVRQQGIEQIVVMSNAEAVLGRLPDNEVVISDPLASRKHARIVREGGGFWVEDLGSKNGTSVNGRPITRQKLEIDDQIKIGDATVTFTLDNGYGVTGSAG